MSGLETREALDRLAQAAKDSTDNVDAVDEDYRLVGAALADAERTAGEQIAANFALTAQLQAAQATIAEAKGEYEEARSHGWAPAAVNKMYAILSRADAILGDAS